MASTRARPHRLLLALLLACSGGGDKETDGQVTFSTGSTAATDASTTDAATATATTTAAPTTSETTGASSSTTNAGSGTDSATEGTTEGTTDPTGGGQCEPIACAGKIYACGDCMDNDGDGKIDLADLECVSPCDDREDTFATGLPGDNMDPCNQDCFFDGNSGAGDDKCNWSLKCDPLSPGGDVCPYDPDFKNCPDGQAQQCTDTCNTPSGCDCFGCCTVEVGGQSYDIFLGDPDCSLKDIDACASCTKNDDCDNTCIPENCELCFGQTELPPGCEEPSCDNGLPCTIDTMGNDDCPDGTYCSTGCCYPVPG